jgi:hypothetical protein
MIVLDPLPRPQSPCNLDHHIGYGFPYYLFVLRQLYCFLLIRYLGMGITLLQMSKVDPTTLKLDRRSTILLQATKRPTELQEKSISGFEEYVPFLVSMILTLLDFSTIVDRFVSSSQC